MPELRIDADNDINNKLNHNLLRFNVRLQFYINGLLLSC